MLIFKQFTAEDTKIDSEERTITAVISTGAVDRDREVLVPGGIIVENFMKSPVVLWAHDYSDTPIGKAMWIKKGREKITAKFTFAETDKAEEVYQLFKGGFLNAFSVGFNPLEASQPTPDEVKSKPAWAEARRIFRKWELLEFSAVPVPANPEALAVAVKGHKVELSAETLTELNVLEDEIEQTFYAEVKENTYTEGATVEGSVCTVTDSVGNITIFDLVKKEDKPTEVTEIDVAIAIEKIFNVGVIPVGVSPCIEISPIINISAMKRKHKGVMYE